MRKTIKKSTLNDIKKIAFAVVAMLAAIVNDPADLAEPLLDIKFDTNGKPYVKLPALANT